MGTLRVARRQARVTYFPSKPALTLTDIIDLREIAQVSSAATMAAAKMTRMHKRSCILQFSFYLQSPLDMS